MYNYSLETYLLLVDTQCVLVQLPKEMFLQHLVCLVISTNLFYGRSGPNYYEEVYHTRLYGVGGGLGSKMQQKTKIDPHTTEHFTFSVCAHLCMCIHVFIQVNVLARII